MEIETSRNLILKIRREIGGNIYAIVYLTILCEWMVGQRQSGIRKSKIITKNNKKQEDIKTHDLHKSLFLYFTYQRMLGRTAEQWGILKENKNDKGTYTYNENETVGTSRTQWG